MRAKWPAMTGAAKLLPVPTIVVWPFQATSTSMPGAPHSAGAVGLYQNRSRSAPGAQATSEYAMGPVAPAVAFGYGVIDADEIRSALEALRHQLRAE